MPAVAVYFIRLHRKTECISAIDQMAGRPGGQSFHGIWGQHLRMQSDVAAVAEDEEFTEAEDEALGLVRLGGELGGGEADVAGFDGLWRDAPGRKGRKGIGGGLIQQCVGFRKKRVVRGVNTEALREPIGLGHTEHGGDDDDSIQRVLGTEVNLDPAHRIGLGCQAAVKSGVLLRLRCG